MADSTWRSHRRRQAQNKPIKDQKSKLPSKGRSGAGIPASTAKTRLDTSPADRQGLFDRESSPSKTVHFGRGHNLIQGPSVSDPARRSQSPTRPALQRRGAGLDRDSQAVELDGGIFETNAPRRASMNPARPQNAGKSSASTKHSAGITKTQGRYRNQQPRTVSKSLAELQQLKDTTHRALKRIKQLGMDVADVSTTECTEGLPDASFIACPAPQKDKAVCNRMDELRAEILAFAKTFPEQCKDEPLEHLLKPENEQLVRYIGCLAMGGKAGMKGWENLLKDVMCRQALVCGIISRALKEKVFNDLCFGAGNELIDMLADDEKEHAQQDGFFRTERRADLVSQHGHTLAFGDSVHRAVAKFTAQLEKMLLPIWKLGPDDNSWITRKRRKDLATIVDRAAHMSHIMRLEPDIIYYWPPTFKDEEFEPKRMECFNLEDMLRDSPYDKKTINGYERAVLRPGREEESEAIVRVVCFPGLVAYRRGGGELAQKELADEKAIPDTAPPDVQKSRKVMATQYGQKPLTGLEGFRTKVICKSVVVLQWSKQRLLTKEAGTSTHLDAIRSGNQDKYRKDYGGFVELYDHFREQPSVPARSEQPSPSRSWLSFGCVLSPTAGASENGAVLRKSKGRGGSRRPSRAHRS